MIEPRIALRDTQCPLLVDLRRGIDDFHANAYQPTFTLNATGVEADSLRVCIICEMKGRLRPPYRHLRKGDYWSESPDRITHTFVLRSVIIVRERGRVVIGAIPERTGRTTTVIRAIQASENDQCIPIAGRRCLRTRQRRTNSAQLGTRNGPIDIREPSDLLLEIMEGV